MSFLAHPHTPPAMNLTMGREMTTPLIPRTIGTPFLPWLFIFLTHRSFPGFTHAVFPLRTCGWCGCILPHRPICGFCVVATHATSWELFGHCHPRIFLWRANLRSGTVCKFSSLICGSCICFSLCFLGSSASFSHAQAGILYFLPNVVWVSFPGDFVVQDGLLFPNVVSCVD